MTLPASGTIQVSEVSVEIGRAATATTSLGETAVRNLAGVASGAISMSNLHGKAAMSATGVNSNVSRNSNVTTTGTATPSVTVSGGTAPYSFSWVFVSNPDGCVLTNATSQTCSVTKTFASGSAGSAAATVRCTITDANTNTTTADATGSVNWDPL